MADSEPSTRAVALAVAAIAVVALAVLLRFYRLGARPVHYDEGVHAYYAWRFAVEGAFTYEPWRHGPLLYYLTAPLMWLFCESIVLGRAVVAALSLAVFPALYLLRRDFPTPALLFAATVLAVHPYSVRAARLYRNDAMLAAFCLLLVGLYATYRRSPSRLVAGGLGATVGLAFATKEVALLIVPTIVLPVVLVAHFDGRFTGRDVRDILARYAPVRHVPVGIATGAFVLLALYSNWPPDPTEIGGAVEGVLYWSERSGGGSGEVTYYLDRFVGATPGLALLAAVGTVGTVVRTRASWLRWVFLSWAGVAATVLSLIPDQSWWNTALVLPPIAVLAGCGAYDASLAVRRAYRRRVTRPSRNPTLATVVSAAGPVAVALLLVSAGTAVPNLTADEDDLGEQGVAGLTATAEDTRKQAYLLARQRALETNCPVVIGPSEYDWPGPWWLRDVEFDVVDEWDGDHWPAVVVDREPIAALEDRSARTQTVGTYLIYVPETGCD